MSSKVALVPTQVALGPGKPGPTLVVTGERVLLDGEALPIPSEAGANAADSLAGVLREKLPWIRKSTRTGPVRVLLDAQTPWRRVATIFQSLVRAGEQQAQVAVKRRGSLRPPEPSGAHDEIVAAARAPKASEGLIEDIWGQCAQGQRVVDAARALAPERRVNHLVEQLPSAVLACGCQVDLHAATELVWSWTRLDRELVGFVGLRISGSSGTRVGIADNRTWSQSAQVLLNLAGQRKTARF